MITLESRAEGRAKLAEAPSKMDGPIVKRCSSCGSRDHTYSEWLAYIRDKRTIVKPLAIDWKIVHTSKATRKKASSDWMFMDLLELLGFDRLVLACARAGYASRKRRVHPWCPM